MPSLIAPMLATAGTAPSGAGWAYEFKYDEVRASAYVRDGHVRLLSRNGNDVSRSYPEIAELGMLLSGRQVVLDGEIVALESWRRCDIRCLQYLTILRPGLRA